MYEDYSPTDFDENWDFNQAVNVLINKEVEARTAEKVDNYAAMKKENEKYKKENYQLKNQIRQIDRDHEQQLKKALTEKEKEVQRLLFGGVAVGDTVYLRERHVAYKPCDHCDGTHKIKVEHNGITKNADCPFCNYSGQVEDTVSYTAKKDTIGQIVISVYNGHKERAWGKLEMKYEKSKIYLEKSDYDKQLHSLYATEQDAIDEKPIKEREKEL